MAITKEEKILLERLSNGEFDGLVGDHLFTTGGSMVWKTIKNGIPRMFKEGPGGKFFDGKESVAFDGVKKVLKEWISDEEKLQFLRKFGWLMKDAAVKAYSSKFKPK